MFRSSEVLCAVRNICQRACNKFTLNWDLVDMGCDERFSAVYFARVGVRKSRLPIG
jgi:hypothetical protein